MTKKQRQRQATNPEENRQRDNLQITKLGDDQERKPFSQVAQNERERVIGQHEEKKTQWIRTAKKVQEQKPAPPMRKNRPEQKKYQKNRDSF